MVPLLVVVVVHLPLLQSSALKSFPINIQIKSAAGANWCTMLIVQEGSPGQGLYKLRSSNRIKVTSIENPHMFAKSFSFTVLSHLKQIFSSILPPSLTPSLPMYVHSNPPCRYRRRIQWPRTEQHQVLRGCQTRCLDFLMQPPETCHNSPEILICRNAGLTSDI